MEFGTTLSGLDELKKVFELMPLEMEKSILRDASKEAMEPVLADAKTACPVYQGPAGKDITPGALRDSIRIKTRTRGGAGELVTSVVTGAGDFTGDFFYGPMVELGHRIGHRLAKGEAETRGQVPAHPFIRPAWDKNKDAIPDRMAAAVRAGIESVVGTH